MPEDVDVADVQTLRPQEDAMYACHLPTLPLVKADCLQLVQVEDAVVTWPRLHNKPQHATRPPCTQTYSRPMQIGTYVFCVALTLRMGIHQNMSGTMEVGKSSGRIRSNKYEPIHFGGVRCVHEGNAQKPVAALTLWGRAGRY